MRKAVQNRASGLSTREAAGNVSRTDDVAAIGVMLWVSFKGPRVVKGRLEHAKIGEFTRALGQQ